MPNNFRGGHLKRVHVVKLPKFYDKPTDAANAASEAQKTMVKRHPGWGINFGSICWFGRHVPILYVIVGPESTRYNLPVGRDGVPVCEVWEAIDKRPPQVAPDGKQSIHVPKQVVRYFGINGEVVLEMETD